MICGLLNVNKPSGITSRDAVDRVSRLLRKVKVETVRYVIASIRRDEAAIAWQKERLGWRLQATNMPEKRCGLTEAVLIYNEGWSVERDFHMLKDRPLGIQPLFVREEETRTSLSQKRGDTVGEFDKPCSEQRSSRLLHAQIERGIRPFSNSPTVSEGYREARYHFAFARLNSIE